MEVVLRTCRGGSVLLARRAVNTAAGWQQRAATGAATRTPAADCSQPLQPSSAAQETFSDRAGTGYGSDGPDAGWNAE